MELKGKKSLSNETVFFLLSDRFGWTPSQIRNMSIIDIQNYLEMISIKNKIENKKYGK